MTKAEYEKTIKELAQEHDQIFTPNIRSSELYKKGEAGDNDLINKLFEKNAHFNILIKTKEANLGTNVEHKHKVPNYEKNIELIKSLIKEIKDIVAKIKW